MRIAYLTLAEAATSAGPEKVNALGMGVRRFLAPTFPTLLNAVVLVQAEASIEELGSHPIKFALKGPAGRPQSLIEGMIELEEREGFDSRRPLTWTAQVPLTALSIERAGGYELSVRVGKARAAYRFVVDEFEGYPEAPGLHT